MFPEDFYLRAFDKGIAGIIIMSPVQIVRMKAAYERAGQTHHVPRLREVVGAGDCCRATDAHHHLHGVAGRRS